MTIYTKLFTPSPPPLGATQGTIQIDNRQYHCLMSISEEDAPPRSTLYFANSTVALCQQIPSGAVAFRDVPPLPHLLRRLRLGNAASAFFVLQTD